MEVEAVQVKFSEIVDRHEHLGRLNGTQSVVQMREKSSQAHKDRGLLISLAEDLQRENNQLKSEVRDLRREVAGLNIRLKELEWDGPASA